MSAEAVEQVNNDSASEDSAAKPRPKKKPDAVKSKKVKKAKPVKKKRRERESGRFTQILAILIVFLAFYLAFSLFIAGLILYSFNDTVENTEIYSLNVIYDERTLHKINAETANTEFGLYIPFDYLAEIGSFGLAGDGNDAILYLIGTDNRIECNKNSSLVTINGNPVRIAAPILFRDGEYLIPVVLIENYINGIDVTYDNEKMICIVSSDLGKSDVALKLRLPEALDQPNYFTDEDRYYGDELSESE